MSITFRVHENLADVPMTEQSWDDLVARADVGGVFLQKSWISSWWKSFGHAFSLYFVTAESSERVLAFAPLMIDQERTLRFIGDLNADYLGFVIPLENGDLISDFMRFISESRDQWRVMHLRNIVQRANDNHSLADACREVGLLPWNNYSVTAPYLQIASNDEDLEAMSNKYRYRRAERLLREQGTLKYEVFSTNERAACFWDAFAQQHIDRCKKDNRKSTFSNPNYLPFLKSLFESDLDNTNVHFSCLFLADRPVAFHFGFLSQNRLLWYKPSFDINVRKGSPGVILTHRLIEYARMHGIGELDFTIGDEPFKDRFCKLRRTVDEYRIHKSLLFYIADTGYWRVRQFLKLARTVLRQ